MACSTEKAKINETVGRVRDASFKEKEGVSSEHFIDFILDQILEVKKLLKNKISEIEGVIVLFEDITWYDFNKLGEDSKKDINVVISSTKDWISSLRMHYNHCFEKLANIKIEISEVDELRLVIDDLEEANMDLENVVFHYPNDKGFQCITEELSRL